MKRSKTLLLFIFLANILASSFLYAEENSRETVNARYTFLNAEKALKKKDLKQYQELMAKIQDYPLYPYLVYEGIKYKINHAKPSEVTLKEINTFEAKYPDFPFKRHLREAWLSKMAKAQQWALYSKGYQPSKNEEMQCYYAYSQYQITKNPAHLNEAKKIWVTARTQPQGCDLLYRAWAKNKGLTHHAIWARYELALDYKEEALKTFLIKLLPAKEKIYATEWAKIYKNPYALNNMKHFNSLKMPPALQAKILRHTVKQLGKHDAENAISWWEKNNNLYPFSETQKNQLKRDIAIYLAHQKNPLATDWLKRVAVTSSDPLLQLWQIRMSLLNENWEEVLKQINNLKPEEQQENVWQYWRARSLESLNNEGQALPLYTQLAKTRGYYGFLASLRLNKPISLEHAPIVLDEAKINKITAQPNIKRFIELTNLKRTAQARHEWLVGIENLSEGDLSIAAKMVDQMELHDLALSTINLSSHKNDIAVRFPLAHQDDIFNKARKHNLDPAWVFAIARQESAFHTHAVSPVGARGLMQLMPTSAELLSKKHNIYYGSEMMLHEPEVNIDLGCAYLKQLKNNLNESVVLASASYNAGPLQIRKWMPKQRLDADIWIETIPYLETREYVKNVIALTSIYRHRLGNSPAFAKLMQPIPAKSKA